MWGFFEMEHRLCVYSWLVLSSVLGNSCCGTRGWFAVRWSTKWSEHLLGQAELCVWVNFNVSWTRCWRRTGGKVFWTEYLLENRWFDLEISQANSQHISATASKILSWLTEITVRRYTSMISSHGQFSFSFALQISSFKSTGSTKNRISAFNEINHHNTNDIIPFSIWFENVSAVPLLFWSRPRKRPMSLRNFSSIICNHKRIRNTGFSVSFFSPYNVVMHWHEDNSSLELLRFTLFQSSYSESQQGSATKWNLGNLSTPTPSVDSIQFFVLTWIHKPIDLLLPCFDGIWTDSSHTQYWIGEDVGFCSRKLDCL